MSRRVITRWTEMLQQRSVLAQWHQQQRLAAGSAIGAEREYSNWPKRHSTTVICIKKDGEVVMMADGQVTGGSMVVKPNARKLRRLAEGVVGGFAGGAADGLTLFERLETKLEEHPGQLRRAAVELAKAWRQDRVLRRLEAQMIVADSTTILELSGDGDVLEPHDGVMGIGSGAGFAVAAARALMDVPGMTAYSIAQKAMKIAAETCVYTNSNFTWEIIRGSEIEGGSSEGGGK